VNRLHRKSDALEQRRSLACLEDRSSRPRLIAGLRQAGCEPEDLEIGRADLEDVFLEIMNGPPRSLGQRAAAV